MKVATIFVLWALLAGGTGLSAQDDIPRYQVLAAHLRPAWIQTGLQADAPDSGDLLASVGQLKLAKKAKRPTLLLVYSSKDQISQTAFEQVLFQHPRVVLGAKVFVCLRLDVRKNRRVAEAYGDAVPRIVLFDAKGRRRADISMAGFRQRPDALCEFMERVLIGYGSMPLPRFLKRYRELLRDLVPVESARRKLVEREVALARKPSVTREQKEKLEADREELMGKRKAWLAREKALFREYHRGKKGG